MIRAPPSGLHLLLKWEHCIFKIDIKNHDRGLGSPESSEKDEVVFI